MLILELLGCSYIGAFPYCLTDIWSNTATSKVQSLILFETLSRSISVCMSVDNQWLTNFFIQKFNPVISRTQFPPVTCNNIYNFDIRLRGTSCFQPLQKLLSGFDCQDTWLFLTNTSKHQAPPMPCIFGSIFLL